MVRSTNTYIAFVMVSASADYLEISTIQNVMENVWAFHGTNRTLKLTRGTRVSHNKNPIKLAPTNGAVQLKVRTKDMVNCG